MSTKRQKNIRVSHPQLFDRARELLENELGAGITDAQIITAALTWLIAARTQKLIPADQVARALRENAAQSVINALEVLADAGLIEAGDYEVHVKPETGAARLVKDGVPINPKPEHSGAVDVEEIMKNVSPQNTVKQTLVN